MRQRIPYKQSAKAYQAVVNYYNENFDKFREVKKQHSVPEIKSNKSKLNTLTDLVTLKARALKSLIGKRYMLLHKEHTIKTEKEAEIVSSLNYAIY